MRKIFWIAIAAIWLIVIGFVAFRYLHAPDKNKFYAVEGFVSIGRDYVNGVDIDMSKIKGDDNNAQYLKILGNTFQQLENSDRELTRQTDLLMAQLQTRNLSSAQSLDISLQQANEYQKTVNDSYAKTEAVYQQMATEMGKVDTKNIAFDVKGLIDSVGEQKDHRALKYQYYSGLAKYVAATIQFVKSRIGYYKIGADGTSLQFSRPVDQDYYNKLISGISAYRKQIDQFNADDISTIRNQVGSVEAALANAKK